MKRERVFARIPKPRVGQFGIAVEDIVRIPIVPELVGEVIDCLESDEDLDVTFGLFFAECLRPRADFVATAGHALPVLAGLIRAVLNHPSQQVRMAAASAFVAFQSSFDDYAVVMRGFLSASVPSIRQIALRAAPTYLSAKELNTLLPFQDDPEIGETGGMGGPLRYDLRDLALETAETIAGRSFSNGDCLERRDGVVISWRSWSKFSQWLESGKKLKFFGL